MSNQISTFNFKSQPVRIQSLNDEPYFCLTDVCLVLGVNRRSSEAFRLNEKGCNKIAVLTEGGMQEVVFINEPNLYRIIFRSNKSQAIDFQNWVFEEVLPQIRKTGQYSQNEQQTQPLVKPEVRYPASFTGAEIYSLVWLLISHRNMNDLLGELEQPLAAIGSNFHPAVYSHHREYKRLIDENLPILKRLIEPFKESNPIEFERIKSRLKLN
ncbi:P22AR C-terminal domain-containing protein [uncultured Actinobacillus sp.]|uniref:P22AR C-terminal domain-containing protein n=1 Tax=uncultured Actinobacillus sp. TaxID=417616 RepID=UPI0025E0612F|nr:P22AR C-terminal domain-containing protein [uncultured Actinobacillus sp.]